MKKAFNDGFSDGLMWALLAIGVVSVASAVWLR